MAEETERLHEAHPMRAPQPRNRCCNEAGCHRQHPILIRLQPFSRRWVAITSYTGEANGRIRAIGKHDIHDDLVHELVAQGWTPPPTTTEKTAEAFGDG
jgi:hypothetical protein